MLRDPKRVRPFGDQVFVEIDPKWNQSAGGIVMPDNVKYKLQDRFCTVLKVGPDVPKHIKPGMFVIVNWVEGTNITMDLGPGGDQFKMVPAVKVLAAYEPE